MEKVWNSSELDQRLECSIQSWNKQRLTGWIADSASSISDIPRPLDRIRGWNSVTDHKHSQHWWWDYTIENKRDCKIGLGINIVKLGSLSSSIGHSHHLHFVEVREPAIVHVRFDQQVYKELDLP